MFLDLVQLLAAAAWMKRTTALRGLLAACLADPKPVGGNAGLPGTAPPSWLVPLTLATGAA